jgi:hypothetical protein
MQDLIGDFDSIKECDSAFENQDCVNYEIFDSKERVIVECNWLPDYNEVHNVNDPLFDLSHLSKLYPKKLWNIE